MSDGLDLPGDVKVAMIDRDIEEKEDEPNENATP
jgi:hypothetical protein